MFREHLPEACPPLDAQEPSNLVVYRLIPDLPAVALHFASHASLGKKMPGGIDPCRWASCSVFASMESVNDLRKLPKFKLYKWAIKLVLGSEAGRVKSGEAGHYDWWIYSGYDPIAVAIPTACEG